LLPIISIGCGPEEVADWAQLKLAFAVCYCRMLFFYGV